MGNIVINIVTVIFFDGEYTQAGTNNRNTLCNSNVLNVLKMIKKYSVEDDGYESFLVC